MIFKQCIETCIFPSSWKKGNIVLIHKNGDKHLKNYFPVSLLPICGKILDLIHQISLVLNRVILVLISCYLLLRCMDVLIWGLKLEASSMIYREHLTLRGMMVPSTN